MWKSEIWFIPVVTASKLVFYFFHNSVLSFDVMINYNHNTFHLLITIFSFVLYSILKTGFWLHRFKTEYTPVSLSRIQYFIDSKRIDPNEKITIDILWKSGAISGRIKDGVKLLGGVSFNYSWCKNINLFLYHNIHIIIICCGK